MIQLDWTNSSQSSALKSISDCQWWQKKSTPWWKSMAFSIEPGLELCSEDNWAVWFDVHGFWRAMLRRQNTRQLSLLILIQYSHTYHITIDDPSVPECLSSASSQIGTFSYATLPLSHPPCKEWNTNTTCGRGDQESNEARWFEPLKTSCLAWDNWVELGEYGVGGWHQGWKK